MDSRVTPEENDHLNPGGTADDNTVDNDAENDEDGDNISRGIE